MSMNEFIYKNPKKSDSKNFLFFKKNYFYEKNSLSLTGFFKKKIFGIGFFRIKAISVYLGLNLFSKMNLLNLTLSETNNSYTTSKTGINFIKTNLSSFLCKKLERFVLINYLILKPLKRVYLDRITLKTSNFSYQGRRIKALLPLRGQRTKTNAKSVKSYFKRINSKDFYI